MRGSCWTTELQKQEIKNLSLDAWFSCLIPLSPSWHQLHHSPPSHLRHSEDRESREEALLSPPLVLSSFSLPSVTSPVLFLSQRERCNFLSHLLCMFSMFRLLIQSSNTPCFVSSLHPSILVIHRFFFIPSLCFFFSKSSFPVVISSVTWLDHPCYPFVSILSRSFNSFDDEQFR